jgi:hypothetical protein
LCARQQVAQREKEKAGASKPIFLSCVVFNHAANQPTSQPANQTKNQASNQATKPTVN